MKVKKIYATKETTIEIKLNSKTDLLKPLSVFLNLK